MSSPGTGSVRQSRADKGVISNPENGLLFDSTAEKAVEENPAPATPYRFPEGGTKAWLVVLGCWCTSFCAFGYINSFGVYETYYLQTFLSGYSASDVAWIGSVQAFAQFSVTLFSGPISDRHGPLVVIYPCSLLLVVGVMLTSLCTQMYQFVLCQGILVGISAGFIFAPALSVVGHYFCKKRALAMALASTGSPIGGIVYPIIMASSLQNGKIGFEWGQRICGFLTLFLLLIACITIRPTPFRRKGSLAIPAAFKKPAFSLQVAALFLVVLGLWTPYFYLAQYGLEHGMASGLASYLFALLNAGSFIGRVLGGQLAVSLGQFNIITLACFGSAILLYCWLEIVSPAGLIALSVFFGGTSGIIIALMMSTVAHVADHPSQIGTYIGQSTFVVGFAGLAGTPITGALIDKYQGYNEAIIFSATVIMAGAVIFVGARYTFAPHKLIA